MNAEIFATYIETQLAPTLAPRDIVILDNVPFHKGARIEGIVKARGAWMLFLPAYSPDLNPIEQLFSKLKHWMRIAQHRTIEEVWRHVGRILDTVQPHECANYLRNAGYASIQV